MLYLFGSGAWENNRRVVKIGFSDNMEKRRVNYNHYNPLGKFLGEREGDRKDELRLHLRLYDHRVEFLDEWFYDEEEVFRVFNEDSYDTINTWLWEHRREVLLYPQIPLPGTLKRELLDDLQKINKSSNINGEKLL